MARLLPLVAALAAAYAPVALAGGGYDWNLGHVRWNTLETEHFWIHWPESTLPQDDPHWFTTAFTATELGRIAEESYPLITDQFGIDLVERTHVVVYDQDVGWEGNGFAIAEMDWTGFAAEWGPVFRERGRMEFLSDVFVHEFAHIVSLKAFLPWDERSVGFQLGGLSEDEEWLRRLGANPRPNMNFDVGFDMPVIVHTPFWWAEGGAEYWSHMAGYNFWGTSRDAYLRTSVLEDRLLTFDEWVTRIDKEGGDGERGYNQGYAFGLWLYERFGTHVMTEMARISAEHWHWSWNRVVEEATGVPAEQLYTEWVHDLVMKYGAQRDAVAARGLAIGRELAIEKPMWEEPVHEDWAEMSKREREEVLDGATSWMEMATASPDGQRIAWFEDGLNIVSVPPESLGFLGGEYIDPEADDVRDQYKALEDRWVTVGWADYYRPAWSPDSTRLVVTGGEDLTAEPLMNSGFTFNADGRNWRQLVMVTLSEEDGKVDSDWEKIPNTLRATEAAWHPTEDRIAFARYADGTHELWTVSTDGSNPTQLTDFGDGTQVQGLSYSPDGSTLLMSLFRNFQQDLWLFELESGAWTRLTDSAADETDPVFGPEGMVWFTSDADGILNVYSLDLSRNEIEKQSDVLGSAYFVFATRAGSVMYSGITGHGFRIFGLTADELTHTPVTYAGHCGATADCADSDAFISHRPAAPTAPQLSKRYNAWRGTYPLTVWPVLRSTDRNVEFGAALSLGDVVEEHYADAEFTFGKDRYAYLGYWNDQFWPSIGVGYARYAYKGTYGYGIDIDGLPETDDLSVVDVKFEQLSEDVWLTLSRYANDHIWFAISADASRYSFRDSGDGTTWVPYIVSSGVHLSAEYTMWGVGSGGDDWINPRGGRSISVDVGLRFSTLVDKEISGAVYDDGQLMDQYHYIPIHGVWSEYIPVPFTERHTLQLDFEAGWIDRNVMGWDEFYAGGRHPYHWGNGQVGSNSQFSGYEGWSLTGETMLIGSASYRFPIARDMNLRIGPTYTDKLYLQLSATAGNLWSHRIDGPSHIVGGYVVPDDPADVRREVPFRDYSAKNSVPGSENYILTDLGAELRIRSFLWNDYDWDSFLRLSYGLSPTAGYGDVNADLIQSSVARDAASELSGEFEPATLRIYAGFGTGW